jgi:beta-galactosidase
VAGGDNVVAVRVDNSLQPSARWYTGSGIYRHVWLNFTDPLRVALHWGT